MITLANGLKGQYCAPFTLCAVAALVDNGAFVNLAVSLPSRSMQPLVDGLRGSHTIVVNGKRKHFVIDQVAAKPEGLGTATRLWELKAQRSTTVPSFAALDFGYGNTTVVAIDPKGTCRGFANTPTGVGALFDEIATALSARSGGIPPTADAVRLGIESQTFRLNGYGSVSFEDEYWAALENWVRGRIQEMRAPKLASLLERAEVKVCCGGGANLPQLDQFMPSDCVFPSNPQELEAQGLQRFAEAL